MRLFTPEEANAALAHVRPLVERLVARRRELAAAEARLGRIRAAIAGNGGGLRPADLAAAEAAAARAATAVGVLAEEIEALGAQVKDADRGLVDFPAAHPDGRTVFLCWQLGEEEVRYWHGPEEGFAGRKALPF